ncbi:MAG: hypothetical protein AB7U92_08640 [Piscinibacter sp.]|uniref:hypothetical protein n=1 Tax=Piscinibacter sp. TaxID=1903157 RepID=UPI003D12876B
MDAAPLTHHEVLALAEPFVRRGIAVDLAASDRIARRIALRARELDAAAHGLGTLREGLTLESLPTGTLRLVRTLAGADGPEASAEAMGSNGAELLERVMAVPPSALLRRGHGFVLARHQVVHATARVFARGVVRLDDLELTMTVSPVRGVAAELRLVETGTVSFALPDDLLAVLGWDWTRLMRERGGWRTRLRLRGGSDRRTRTAEAELDRAAEHLARTLADPPSHFHERHRGARLFAMFRRSIPLLTPVALVIAVLSLPRFDVEASPLWVLMYHVPTLLIALAFLLQELPAFEIPPWPRARREPSWRISPAGPARR